MNFVNPVEEFAKAGEAVDRRWEAQQEDQAFQKLSELAQDPQYKGQPISQFLEAAGTKALESGSAKFGLKMMNQASLAQAREAQAAENTIQAEERQLNKMESTVLGLKAIKDPTERASASVETLKAVVSKMPPEQRPIIDKAILDIQQNPQKADGYLNYFENAFKTSKTRLAEQNLLLQGVKLQQENEKFAETQRHNRVTEAQGQQKIDLKGPMSFPDVFSGLTAEGRPETAGLDKLKSAGIPVISAGRTAAQQEALKYRQDPKTGQWFTKEGNPVSETSAHLTGNAIDVDNSKLTKQQRVTLADEGWYQPLPQKDPNHWERRTPVEVGAKQPTGTNEALVLTEKALADPKRVAAVTNFINKDVKTASQRVDTGTVKSVLKNVNPDEWAALDTPKAMNTVAGSLDAARQAKHISDFVKEKKVSTGALGELIKTIDKYNPEATVSEAIGSKKFGENEQILGKLILDFANAYARSERGGATPMATVAELKAAMATFGVGAMSPNNVVSAFNYIAEHKLAKTADNYFGGNRNAILMPNLNEKKSTSGDTVTLANGTTYSRPANFTDAQWNSYKQSVGR